MTTREIDAPIDFTLYAVLDAAVLDKSGRSLEEAAGACIRGGAGILQLRDKAGGGRRVLDAAERVLVITRRWGIPLVVNDRADVALAAGADGVHVGREDISVAAARRLLGPRAIVGGTARSIEEAEAAQESGATYVGIGSLFTSRTKTAPPMAIDVAERIARALAIPVVAIGGIDEDGASMLSGRGLAGVAVCGALLGGADVEEAARRIRAAFRGGRG